MNQSTKLYIYAVLGLGALVTTGSLLSLQVTTPALFALLLALATVGATLKVRVPGIDGNMSLSFLPTILSPVLLSIPEAVLLVIAATLVQTTVRVKNRNALKIAFNCAAIALSIAIGGAAGQTVAGQNVPLIQLALTGGVFYVVNSILITTVIGLVSNRKVSEIWNECLQTYLPYFAIGLACAAVAFTGATADERRTLQYPGLAVLPLMLLARQYVLRTLPFRATESHS